MNVKSTPEERKLNTKRVKIFSGVSGIIENKLRTGMEKTYSEVFLEMLDHLKNTGAATPPEAADRIGMKPYKTRQIRHGSSSANKADVDALLRAFPNDLAGIAQKYGIKRNAPTEIETLRAMLLELQEQGRRREEMLKELQKSQHEENARQREENARLANLLTAQGVENQKTIQRLLDILDQKQDKK